MKKVIFGSSLTAAGLLSLAILIAALSGPEFVVYHQDFVSIGGIYHYREVIAHLRLAPVFVGLIVLTVAGLLLGVWGLLEGKGAPRARSERQDSEQP